MQIHKYFGTIHFLKSKSFLQPNTVHTIISEVKKSVRFGNEIIVYVQENDQQASGTLSLTTVDSIIYEGKFEYDDILKSGALVTMEFFENESKALLIGEWNEDAVLYTTIIRLTKIIPSDANPTEIKFI